MTEHAMTEPDASPGVGERAFRENRKRLWRLVWLGVGISFCIGLASGFIAGFTEGWENAGGSAISWIVWPVLAIGIWGFVLFTRGYFRRVDELDVQDNLWASLIGLYFYLAALPCWMLLHKVGQLPPPDHWILWGATFLSACIAYGWRKLRP
jgi:Na+-driven multidrug efflux pump